MLTTHRIAIRQATTKKQMVAWVYDPEPPGSYVLVLSCQTYLKIVSEYDQVIPQSQTADNPVAPWLIVYTKPE